MAPQKRSTSGGYLNPTEGVSLNANNPGSASNLDLAGRMKGTQFKVKSLQGELLHRDKQRAVQDPCFELGHSLAQPVVLRSKTPAAVPFIQDHEPAMDRMKQLQRLSSGIL